MRKLIASVCFCLFIQLFANAQTDDKAVWKRVDSLKNELKTAKGKDKVDCLNLLAEYYFFIWEDDDKLQDTACIYSDRAFAEAKKINYKVGIAYALANRAHCAAGETDNDIKNNDKDPTYANAYKTANEAIKYAEGLNNNYIIGSVYDVLKWMERWRGTPDKFKTNLERAILYYEKVSGNEFKDNYKPLFLTDCPGCKGAESEVAGLYLQLANTEPAFSNTKESLLQKAIAYSKKAGNKSTTAQAYLLIAVAHVPTGRSETGLKYMNEAINLFQEAKDEYGEAEAYNAICSAYFNLGDFEKGLVYSKKNIALAQKLAQKDGNLTRNRYLSQAYYWMGRFYIIADDPETALSYLRTSIQISPFEVGIQNGKTAIAEIHRSLGNYDSAMQYLSFTINNSNTGIGKRILVGVYVSMKEYDKALDLINGWAKRITDNNDFVNQGKTASLAAKAYLGKNDLVTALIKAKEGYQLLKLTNYNFSLIDSYQLLADIYSRIGQNDSAYHYLKLYSTQKDSLLKKQLYIKLNDYKKEAEDTKRLGQIKLLQKDNLIKEQELQQQILLKEQNESQLTILDKDNQIKDQKLKEEILLKEQNESKLNLSDRENKLKDERLKQQTTIRNALLAGLLLFLLLSIFVIRSLSLKRKNEKLAVEKKQAELQQQVAELEMQALRAQMNPHFIFNCLSSINRMIMKNNSQAASDYLTRFSRLMRMVLINSQRHLISLEDELQMLRLYLDMERLRFKDSFDYKIIFSNTIDEGTVQVPPLLLQPFCENAIWHGLMQKDGPGRLTVELSMEDNVLNCIITDNGIGREKAQEIKSKSAENQKSMGLRITTERLALLNREKDLHTYYELEDMKDESGNAAGTKVVLKISTKDIVEETA